jgi:hypothetical protein
VSQATPPDAFFRACPAGGVSVIGVSFGFS